ncbi:hypothetical protein V2J09_009998 [Rumex salicifolius]
MNKNNALLLPLLRFTSCLLLLTSAATASTGRRTFIVHVDQQVRPDAYVTNQEWYTASLESLAVTTTSTTADGSTELLYSYDAAFHGFAARLTADEVESLRRSPSVVAVYEDTVYSLHTTRTPGFLGLDSPAGGGLWFGRTFDLPSTTQDVIVGVLDTGVWPESSSFSDAGMGPLPARWKGECESASDFRPAAACNRKLIGARSFSKGYQMASGGEGVEEIRSPRDYDGHGTHTASTVAGSEVKNASLLGFAAGAARGMALGARLAVYKVCWKAGCFGSDILAGMDQAILDGVDVLSLSLGGGSVPYFRDTIAIGAFAAMQKGIFVSCSAGNSGPGKATLANTAPWIMTVGAGTLDRDFPATAILGNGKRFTGASLYSGPGMGAMAKTLVYGNKGNSSANLCLPGSLNPAAVKGKVVLCDRGIDARVEKGAVVRDAGGVGMILANTASSGEELVADSHLLPTVALGMKAGDSIRKYVKSAGGRAKALLQFKGTVLNVRPSPVVAAFSSRGPNIVTPQIFKPDAIAPGVNILAAWSNAVGPTGLVTDSRKTKFNIMSGTSMSCPHISGLAALIKAAHPDWSPSAIKSALMTTAYTHDNTNSPLLDAADGSHSNPWAYGAGHVDPQKAVSPGLIYDISPDEYVSFLCSLGYSNAHVGTVTKRPNITCTQKLTDPGQLNYPGFSVLFKDSRVVRYSRVVTNVGAARTLYQVSVDAPKSVAVKVRPTKLFFRSVGEKKKYTVTFVKKKGIVTPAANMGFGAVMWSNRRNMVRSPVSFLWT